MEKKIEQIVNAFNSTPFLFVGSGLSRRYYNLPNWEQLLKIFSSKINDDEFTYNNYKLLAEKSECNLGIYPKIAEFIENDFNEMWFKNPSFRNLDEYYLDKVRNGSSPFKAEIASYIKNNSILCEEYKEEVELFNSLSKKSLSGIITTNYDTFLECTTDNYNSFIGQEELFFSNIQGIAEIYKIHGCITRPESIIINENDYLDFDRKCDYLAAKLMTLFLEFPIIFIGYSISDYNIKKILQSIANCLSIKNIKRLQNRFIFIEYDDHSNEIEISPHTITFGHGKEEKSITMTRIKIKDFSKLYKALLTKKSKIPVRILRLFKNEFYNFVKTNEPTAFMKVNCDDDRLDDSDYAIAIGKASDFGLKGLKGIDANEWYRNIILNDIEFSANDLLKYAYPNMIGRYNKLPLNKYLYESDEIFTSYEKVAYDNKFDNIISQTIKDHRNNIPTSQRSVKSIWENNSYSLEKKTRFIAHLYESEIDINELEDVLKEIFKSNINILSDGKTSERTNIRRLIRIFDYLKYYKLWNAKKASAF